MTLVILLLLGLVLAASAHINSSPSRIAAGSYASTSLTISHGCKGKDTTAVTFTIPASLIAVKGRNDRAWNVSYVTKTLSPQATLDGRAISTTVDSVTFTFAAPLPDDQFQRLDLSFYVRPTADIASLLSEAEKATTGGFRTVPIKTLQVCGDTSTNWEALQVDGEPEPESPAPLLFITDNAALVSSSATSTSSGISTAALVIGILGLILGFLSIVAVSRLLKQVRFLEEQVSFMGAPTSKSIAAKQPEVAAV